MAYSILLRPAAARDLKALQPGVRNRIESAVERLSENPRPAGCRKLVGFAGEWRVRVGDYRILYIIDDAAQQVTIARVAHRREAYR
ncbi:MAG TPA: type II toxin-antitoxin system RelE/ParE family toxin [Terriglobia bacterium]